MQAMIYWGRFLTLILLITLFACQSPNSNQDIDKPNIVIIFLDDSGYSDFQPFGQENIPTPNVQKLSEEGVVFTHFYVPQAVCSASRASLLTGCYPGRTKVFGAHGPKERGLETTFPTMGEVFQKAGYKTALFGKWHCGDQADTRPDARGFEQTCGLMYSNDMWKHHPENPEYWGRYPIQFYENGKVTIEDVGAPEQKMLTKWYTEHAVEFINKNFSNPFLLYVPHSMPHVPLFCSDAFAGKSGIGLYGDVTLELDWSVGEITNALHKNGLEENTIIIFTSDNGPWIGYGNHAGKTPFREAKATSFDGGTRSACIIKYPKRLTPKTSTSTFFSIDLLPTLCNLAGIDISDLAIDGKNVWSLLAGNNDAFNPHEYYAISNHDKLESVMSGDGKWKLHLPHSYRSLITPGKDGFPGRYEEKIIELSLFDMENDPFETTDVKELHPLVLHSLTTFANLHQEKFYN